MLFGLTLLIVPWFSYRQLVEMERLLVQGQSNTQLLTAEGISTLFNGRVELFDDLPLSLEDFENLYAHPLQAAVRIDGRLDDWDRTAVDNSIFFHNKDDSDDGDFRLTLGERNGFLYVHLNIIDYDQVFRDPDYLRLDASDHVRVSFIRPDGEDARVLLTVMQPGPITAYEMDEGWQYAATGDPINEVQGYALKSELGINIEFRMPLQLLGSSRFFGLAFADVDNKTTREIVQIRQTLPTAGKESFNLSVLRSPEVFSIIRGLGYAGARIFVIDSQKRVRAETGSYPSNDLEVDSERSALSALRVLYESVRPLMDRVSGENDKDSIIDHANSAEAVINESLLGKPISVRSALPSGAEIIVAAHPIVADDSVIGTVVVEQNIRDILSFESSALQQVILLTVIVLIAVFAGLLTFAARLAWRIRGLRKETSSAIDSYGRLRISELKNEIQSGDEIGDLARSVSSMLSKLRQHNNFLETMPRTLRHEINNPLNILSTSLDNLQEEYPSVSDSKYLDSAKRGVIRIGSIVQNLADAANLEESLDEEEREIVDISGLLKSYVANYPIAHENTELVLKHPEESILADVSDYRIEQLLDKLIDNAIDFHRADTPIKIQLDEVENFFRITVANRGPTFPDVSQKSLFDSMVSHRGQNNNLHFGLGLYVVRVIAEHHGGSVYAANLQDNSGVAIIVELPRVKNNSRRP